MKYNDIIKKNKKLNTLLIMFLILSILNHVIIVGADENEIISIGSAVMGPAETVVIPISIANATEIEGIRLDLVYDPEVVSIMNITANESVLNSVITTDTNETGNMTIVLTNPELITASSDTPLIDITFQAESLGMSTLELKNVELTKGFMPYSPGTVINGEITITTGFNFTIDPVTSPTNINFQTITGTMGSDTTTVNVTCETASVNVTSLNATNWSVEVINMSEGENVITATATDQLGNIESANVTVLLDTVEPHLIL